MSYVCGKAFLWWYFYFASTQYFMNASTLGCRSELSPRYKGQSSSVKMLCICIRTYHSSPCLTLSNLLALSYSPSPPLHFCFSSSTYLETSLLLLLNLCSTLIVLLHNKKSREQEFVMFELLLEVSCSSSTNENSVRLKSFTLRKLDSVTLGSLQDFPSWYTKQH